MCFFVTCMLSLTALITLFLSSTIAAPVNGATPDNVAKSINRGWTTTTATSHYGHKDFLITLNIPDVHDLKCTISGDGIINTWCLCHIPNLPKDSPVDTCISKIQASSSDPNAPMLPDVLIVEWSMNPEKSGPTYAVCGTNNVLMRPDNIHIACDGLQVHGPTNNALTHSASGDGQQIVDATASKKWAYLTICDSLPQRIQDIEKCPLTYSSIQAPIFPRNSLTTRRDISLIIRGSWTTRSATLHYEHDFPMTLDIPSTSGTDCSISGADLSTAWCHCHLSQSGLSKPALAKLRFQAQTEPLHHFLMS